MLAITCTMRGSMRRVFAVHALEPRDLLLIDERRGWIDRQVQAGAPASECHACHGAVASLELRWHARAREASLERRPDDFVGIGKGLLGAFWGPAEGAPADLRLPENSDCSCRCRLCDAVPRKAPTRLLARYLKIRDRRIATRCRMRFAET